MSLVWGEEHFCADSCGRGYARGLAGWLVAMLCMLGRGCRCQFMVECHRTSTLSGVLDRV